MLRTPPVTGVHVNNVESVTESQQSALVACFGNRYQDDSHWDRREVQSFQHVEANLTGTGKLALNRM